MYKLTLSDTKRIVAVADGDYEFHDVFGDDVSLIVIRNNRDYGSYYGTDYGIDKEVQRLADRFSHSPVSRERAISLYLKLIGYSSRVLELRGYSQSDWATAVLVTRDTADSYLESIASSVNAWFRGDVFTLHLEERKTYANVVDVSDTITKWVSIDAVSGWLIEDRESFKEACFGSFGIPQGDWKVEIA